MAYTYEPEIISRQSAVGPQWVCCTNRAMLGAAQSSGAHLQATYRCSYFTTTRGTVNAMRLVYANVFNNATGEEDSTTQPLIVKVAIEANSTAYPVFFNGQREGVIAPGSFLISDPVGILLAANTQFWVRTAHQTTFGTEKWATASFSMDSTNLGESFATNPRDQVDGTSTLTSGSNANLVGPVAIQGLIDVIDPVDAVIIGSSSSVGQGDTAETPTWDWGYLSRWLSNRIGHFKISRATQTVAQWTGTAHTRRMALLAALKPTYAIVQMGANDWAAGTSVATQQANLTILYNQLDALGIRVIGQTYTPITTSSDSWTSVSGQNRHGEEQLRLGINTWIRTRPAPLWGYVEVTDLVETRRNSGIFKAPGWTADGTHLTQQAHRYIGEQLTAKGEDIRLRMST